MPFACPWTFFCKKVVDRLSLSQSVRYCISYEALYQSVSKVECEVLGVTKASWSSRLQSLFCWLFFLLHIHFFLKLFQILSVFFPWTFFSFFQLFDGKPYSFSLFALYFFAITFELYPKFFNLLLSVSSSHPPTDHNRLKTPVHRQSHRDISLCSHGCCNYRPGPGG